MDCDITHLSRYQLKAMEYGVLCVFEIFFIFNSAL